jgi:hypothetical protein
VDPARVPPRVVAPEPTDHTAAWPVRCGLAVACMLTVAPLLAWTQGLGAFAAWFWACTVPALVLVTATLVWWWRSGRYPETVLAARAGVIGGLLGTVAYDLVRIPILATGRQVLAPIDSYGILLLSARASSPVTGFAGWMFHFQNGIFFGLAFALVMSSRRIWWAVGYALVLESGAVFSGFADYYHLRGQVDLIAIAYLAHIPYGLALGWMTAAPARRMESWDRSLRAPVAVCLVALLGVLVAWHRPFATASSSAIVIESDHFHPRWARVAEGGCLVVTNRDHGRAALDGGPVIAAGKTVRWCPTGAGIHRTKISGRGGSGGYVIVDPAG